MRRNWFYPESFTQETPDWPRTRLEALSYSVGVLSKGDGSVYMTATKVRVRGHIEDRPVPRIELKAKSFSFVRKFNSMFSLVLARRMVKVYGPNPEGHYVARYQSKDFFTWWKHNNRSALEALVSTYPREYLQGRFDSDGNVHKGSVYLCGAEDHQDVLESDRRLCLSLGLRTGLVRPYGKVGEEYTFRSKRIKTRQQKLRFSVNAGDFLSNVGGLAVEWRDRALRAFYKGRKWTPWSRDVRTLALKVRQEYGLECKGISDRLKSEFGINVPVGTLYSWIKQDTSSWDEFSTRFSRLPSK